MKFAPFAHTTAPTAHTTVSASSTAARAAAAIALSTLAALSPAHAADTLRIGLAGPTTGPAPRTEAR